MKTVRIWSGLIALILGAGCGLGGEEVRFSNGDVTLAGTLLRPKVAGRVPAVVLIHGSGEEGRGSMRPFARMFLRNGVAALIYDKRSVGESRGEPEAWRYFSFEDLAGDAAAAVRFLAERDDIDADRIGLFAASQGGWVAPLAASKSGRVAFMVQVSASVSTVAEDRLFERAARLASEGFTESEIREATAMQRVDQEFTRRGTASDEFLRLWNLNKEKRWFPRVYLGAEPVGEDHPWRRWYRTVIDFDPVPLIEQLSIPTLWLFGDPAHDRFGPVQASVDRLDALKRSGKPYEVTVFSGADHNLNRVQGGKPAPYEARLSDWLSGVLRAP